MNTAPNNFLVDESPSARRANTCPVRQLIGHVARLGDSFVVYY